MFGKNVRSYSFLWCSASSVVGGRWRIGCIAELVHFFYLVSDIINIVILPRYVGVIRIVRKDKYVEVRLANLSENTVLII